MSRLSRYRWWVALAFAVVGAIVIAGAAHLYAAAAIVVGLVAICLVAARVNRAQVAAAHADASDSLDKRFARAVRGT